MHKLVRLFSLLLTLLLILCCCACQQQENAPAATKAPAATNVPAAAQASAATQAPAASKTSAAAQASSSWHEAQRITLDRCSIGVSRSNTFTFPASQNAVIASYIHPTTPIMMTITEYALDEEMTAIYASAVEQGGNLLELIYGVNEAYMVPGSMRQTTLQVAGGTAFLMAAEDNPAFGGSAISGMGVFFTDGVLLRIGSQDNTATPDKILADMIGMMQSLTVK